MAVAKPRAEGGNKAVVFSGYSLPLVEWLRVSWFFPVDFGLKRIIEQNNIIVAIGEREIYKFPKPLISNPSTIVALARRWRYVCQEVIDNEPLAAGYYSSIKTLKWIEDEPRWMKSYPLGSFSPESVPVDADEVCVVTRRLPGRFRLSHLLRIDADNAEHYLELVADKLYNLHDKQRQEASLDFLVDPEVFLYPAAQRFFKNASKLLEMSSSCFSHSGYFALEELVAFCRRFFEANSEQLFVRGEDGYFVDCHGNLSLHDIYIVSDADGTANSYLLNRASRGSEIRKGDAFNDVASLVLDLEITRMTLLARRFEAAYFCNGESKQWVEVYKYYLAANAIRLALICLERADNTSLRHVVDKATNYVLAAYRLVMGFKAPVIIAIGGIDHPAREEFAHCVKQFTGARYLERDEVFDSEIDSGEPHLNVKSLVGEYLCEHSSLVVNLRTWNRIDRLNLIELAKVHNCSCILVKCTLGREELVNWALDSCPTTFSEVLDSAEGFHADDSIAFDEEVSKANVHYMALELSIPPAQLALEVVRGLLKTK